MDNNSDASKKFKELKDVQFRLENEERDLRNKIEEEVKKYLKDNHEDNPLKTDFTLEVEDSQGLSTLLMPNVTELWLNEEHDDIWLRTDGTEPYYFNELRTSEQMQVLEYLIDRNS